MPLEGHWKRLQTPLRSASRREGRLVVAVAAVLAIAAVAVVFAALQGGSSATGPGCVKVTVAHATGGATIEACGRKAERLCRSVATRDDGLAHQISEKCRSAGLS
jgi:hypothetical protein